MHRARTQSLSPATVLGAQDSLGRARFLVLATQDTHRVLSRWMPNSSHVVAVTTADELAVGMRAREYARVLVDPMLLPEAHLDGFSASLGTLPTRVVLLCPTLDDAICQRLGRIGATGYCDVLALTVSCDPAFLKRRLSRLDVPSAQGALFARVAPLVNQVRRDLRPNLIRLFVGGELPTGAGNLRGCDIVSLRTLQRCLIDAGVVSLRCLVDACRLTRWYDLIMRTECSLTDCAVLAGYTSVRTIRNHSRALVGMSPLSVRRLLDPDEFAVRVFRSLVRD